MKLISPSELSALLEQHPGLPLIDVRTPVEFASEHVKQATNIPLDELSPGNIREAGTITDHDPFYLLCRSGQRASIAAGRFAKEGFPNAVVVEGGTQSWIAAGLPVEKGAANVIGLERQVRIAAGSLVLTGVLLSLFVHPAFIGLSGFVGAGLIFAGITDWCGMGLLLAKAPWNKRRSS